MEKNPKRIKWFKYDRTARKWRSVRMARSLKQAWEKTLLKWKMLAKGEKVEGGTQSCGLCDLFHGRLCVGCPVCLHTGRPSCRGTPFIEWHCVTTGASVKDPEAGAWAQRELEFLREVKKDGKR